jgi:hypothetical protein
MLRKKIEKKIKKIIIKKDQLKKYELNLKKKKEMK